MTKRPWLLAILFASFYTWANTIYQGDGFVNAQGFPLTQEIIGDAGPLMEFTWQLWVINKGIALLAIAALSVAALQGTRQRLLCIVLCLIASGFTWVNFGHLPVWSILFPSVFSDAVGFPFIYHSSSETWPSLFFLNIFIGSFFLALCRRFFDDPGSADAGSRQATLRWTFAVTWTLLLARLNSPFVLFGQGYGGFPLAYQSACNYFPCKHIAWIAVLINVAVGLGILYLFFRLFTTIRSLINGIGTCLWVWANLGSWYRWYDLIGLSDDRLHFGLPFPFRFSNGFSSESARLLLANFIVGGLCLALVQRRAEKQEWDRIHPPRRVYH